MADHIDNALRAAIKALDEVVAPAVDPANPLAGEQLKLVSRYLGFLRGRLPYQAARDRFEFLHYLGLARELRTLGASGLDHVIETGAALAADTGASTAELRATTAALTARISVLLRGAADLGDATRLSIERAVLAASRSLFDMQRAFYLPLGFEPDPTQVPSLEASLARID